MEPQKKGVMYVYKLAAGSQSLAVNLPETTKKEVLRGYWGLRKSKTYRENERGGGRRVVDGGGEVVEGRKSLSNMEARKSVSHVETSVAAVAGFLSVKVLVTDMPGFMQVHAFRCARTTYDSLEKFSSKHMAYNMKKEFDKVYGPAWHCMVGSSFGSFVTHSTGCFLYFSMEKLYILVFKTKVQKALD
ncbi:uncharacterized protein LOC130771576 isoform X1 [Actinidia eriantha]|uniref:uncharacterized protein LOC130771576 isoform X1 n=1 Tax=Actinidia eriantha TaxID=165200 RepID=UPI002590D7AC|nr:uncharacterized protein LOC130771576 isoform X1 [Actinidia eriantha]